MRGFGYTSEQADKVSDNLKAVLEYTLETEKESFEEWIAEYGEDSPLLENHIWHKAFDLLVDFELD